MQSDEILSAMIIIAAVLLVIFGLVLNVNRYMDCKDNGGEYVRALTGTGFACVDEK